MKYSLYYLVNQAGPIDGAKTWQGDYDSLDLAKSAADLAGVAHYSVEAPTDEDRQAITIVYRV